MITRGLSCDRIGFGHFGVGGGGWGSDDPPLAAALVNEHHNSGSIPRSLCR